MNMLGAQPFWDVSGSPIHVILKCVRILLLADTSLVIRYERFKSSPVSCYPKEAFIPIFTIGEMFQSLWGKIRDCQFAS